jgi:hypothetical protein
MHRCATLLAALAVSLLLAGCDLRERFGSAEDRINAAVPLAINIRQARERLAEQLVGAPTDRAAADNAWSGRLRARATSCSPDFTPTWRHSSDEVRAAAGNKSCFAEFDLKLARWIGAQRVRLLLAQPPMPSDNLPPSLTLSGQLAGVSAHSSVAVVTSAEGFEFVTLDGGRSLFKERGTGGQLSLSPNGRLFVQTLSGGVARIRAVEGGETLLELADARSVQWLGSWFLGVRSTSNKPPYLFSLNSAEEAPVVVNTFGSHTNDALLPVPGDAGRFVLLAFTGLYQLQAQEAGGKFAVTAVAEKPGVHQTLMPITMGMGRLSPDGRAWLLDGSGAFVRLDLTSLEVQQTSFAPLHVDGVVPTGKPDQYVLELRASMEAAHPGSRTKYLYDTTAGTLARLEGADAQRPVIYLPGVRRLARLSQPTVWLLDQLETAAPQPVSEVLNAQLDEVNQARLNKVQLEQQRIVASPALQPGSPLLPYVRDAQVEGVGIYEAAEKVAQPGQQRSTGRVMVTVRRSPQPIVLVLCSYEPVQWQLKMEPGARLDAVLVGGYHDSSVLGAGDARVLKMGRYYAYQQEGADFAALQREVSRWVGRPISLFQTGYRGNSYTVGGR